MLHVGVDRGGWELMVSGESREGSQESGVLEPAIKDRIEKAEQGLCVMVRTWIPHQVLSDFKRAIQSQDSNPDTHLIC